MLVDAKSIKQRAEITEVIGDFVKVTKKGAGHVAICPFHQDTDPSLYINQNHQTYTCFVCGAHGDVFDFIIEFNKTSFPDAVKHVATKYGIDINPNYTPEEKQRASERNKMLQEVAKTQALFVSNLHQNKEALDYITIERGFTKQIIEEFGVGYAVNGFYGGRITFPMHNYTSNVVGFSGRILKYDKAKKEVPKYKNTSENSIFHKGELLFGFIQARRAIIEKKLAYFVEGQTDVMMMHQRAIKNTIAGSGTALTPAQARKIRTTTDNIVLVYDGDEAGKKAAFKNIKILLPTGINIYIVTMPEGEDPDSFAKANNTQAILDYLAKNKLSWITYFEQSKESMLADAQQRNLVLNEFVELASEIQDPVKLQEVVQKFCKDTNIDFSLAKSKITGRKIETTESDKHFIGIAQAKASIIEEKSVFICENKEILIELLGFGYDNAIAVPTDLSELERECKKLAEHTRNIIIKDNNIDADCPDNLVKMNIAKVGLILYKQKFNVNFELRHNSIENHDDEFRNYPFINIYCLAKTKTESYSTNDQEKKALIEEMAQLITFLDETMQTLKIPEICKILGIKKETDFRKVIKPFMDKHKSKVRQQNERVIIDDITHIFDITNLPEYVDDAFFRKYRFFEAQNKNGDKIFYVFQTAESTLMKVANFHMTPLFHVWSEDPGKNKRILSIRHESYPASRFIEIKSSDMLNFLKFKEFMFNLGGYLFTNGKVFQYEKILESVALDFPTCKELTVYGLQVDGFYAFPNGILTPDNQFDPVNDLGLVTYKNETYYSPSFSKIWEESERFDTIKMFAYKESNINFNQWAILVNQVYSYNNNGMWAILAVMMAANREFIFNIDRLFTTLFFIGPTDSGKSQIAITIRSVFIREAAPLFNLTSGTDAAFFSIMGSYKDVAVVFEEYNDVTVSENKFQGLKACIYDGEGKTKRADATSEALVTTMVYVMPVLLGQQSPERDDNALSNRVVMRHVPKKDNWTVEEEIVFKELKKYEKQGLSNVLVEILKCKSIIHKHYPGTLKIVRNELRDHCRDNNLQYQTRIVNTVSLFLAMARVVTDFCSEINLPFSYNEFFNQAVDQVQHQSHDVSSTNSLSLFFNAIQSLINNKKVLRGRDFDIVLENSVTINDDGKTTSRVFNPPVKIIYLRVKQIHPEYANFVKKDYMKMNQLNVNLHDHKAFVGNCKAHRFIWEEKVEIMDYAEGRMKAVLKKGEQNTSAVMLQYDILRQTADIDFEENLVEATGTTPPDFVLENNPVQNELF